jgi:dihydrofolate reductase
VAKLVFTMSQSLDGYVDHDKCAPPGPALFQHFIEQVRGLTGSVYGRRIYEIMRVWDEDHPEWSPQFCEFAEVWRRQPKWVVSRSLKSVGPNATLVADDLQTAVRKLKAELSGEIAVAGPALAGSLTKLGLIDEYQIYLRPVVLGSGKPYFSGVRPSLHLLSSDRIVEEVVRLTYIPA